MVCRVEVYELTAGNGDNTENRLLLINVEKVIYAIIRITCFIITAIDLNRTAASSINCCAAVGDKCTVINNNTCAVNRRNNLNVLAITCCKHCAFAGDCKLSAVLRKDYFNDFSVIICCDCMTVKVKNYVIICSVKNKRCYEIYVINELNCFAGLCCVDRILKRIVLNAVNLNYGNEVGICRATNLTEAVCKIVAVRSNNFLCYENCLTYRAVLTFGKTGLGTCGLYCRVNYDVVVELVNNFLCYENLVTYRAMLTFGKACLGTCRSLSCVDYFSVSELINNFLLYESYAANRALLTVSKTGLGAACSLAGNCFLCVSKLFDSLCLSAKLNATYRTVNYAVVRACCRASSVNYVFLNCCALGVRKLFNNLCCSAELFATYRTVNYAVVRACSRASSVNYVFLNCLALGVSELFNNFLCYENLITYRAVLTFGKACLGTCGSLSCVGYLGVSCEFAVCLAAIITNCLSLTGCCAAGVICKLTCVFALTYRANTRVLSFIILRPAAHCVIKLINNFLCNGCTVTSGAVRTFGKTCSCTSRSYSLVNYDVMAESRNNCLRYLVVASCAVLTCGETGFGTSSSNCRINYDVVTESINCFCVAVATNRTSVFNFACV